MSGALKSSGEKKNQQEKMWESDRNRNFQLEVSKCSPLQRGNDIPLLVSRDLLVTSRAIWTLVENDDFLPGNPTISFSSSCLRKCSEWSSATIWKKKKKAQTSNPSSRETSNDNQRVEDGAKNADNPTFLMTVTSCGDRVEAWQMFQDGGGRWKVEEGGPTVLAEDLGQVTGMCFDSEGKFLVVRTLGKGGLWVIRVKKSLKSGLIVGVDHYATLEESDCCQMKFVETGDGKERLLTVDSGCTARLWCLESLKCVHQSHRNPSLWGHSGGLMTSMAVQDGIVALGNACGDVYLLEIVPLGKNRRRGDRRKAIKEEEFGDVTIRPIGSLNVNSALRSKFFETSEETPDPPPSIGPGRHKRNSNHQKSNSTHSPDRVELACPILDLAILAPEKRASPPVNQQAETFDDLFPLPSEEPSQQRCITSWLVVCTSVGIVAADLRAREIHSVYVFVEAADRGGSLFGSVMSEMVIGRNSRGPRSFLGVGRRTMPEEAISFRISLRGKEECEKRNEEGCETVEDLTDVAETEVDETLSVLATSAVSEESFLSSAKSFKAKFAKPSPKKTYNSQRQGRQNGYQRFFTQAKIKSSGYGRQDPGARREMFRPKINRARKCEQKEGSKLSDRSLHNTEETSGGGGGRAKWIITQQKKSNFRPEEARSHSKSRGENEGGTKTSVIDIFSSLCLKVWSTDGAKTRLSFCATGPGILAASSSCDNTIQMFPSVQIGEKNLTEFRRRVESASFTLSGVSSHGQLRSLDFSHRGDLLATSGDDRIVRIWDWKSRMLRLNVDDRRGGRLPGEESGGLISKGIADLKKAVKGGGNVDQSSMFFPDMVIKSQFYYVDQFLLSASANKVFIHELGLPSQPQQTMVNGSKKKLFNSDQDVCWYNLSKTFKLAGCKYVTDLAAINQFFSHLVLCACSDRSLRLIDLNHQTVAREMTSVHQRPIHAVVQPRSNGHISSEAYNLFVTSALGDGAKLWDVRSRNDGRCVQRFEWPGARGGRMPSGCDLSPCLRFLAHGADDGSVYVFDIRRAGSYVDKLGSEEAVVSAVTDVKFNPCRREIVAANQNGEIIIFEYS